MLHNDTEMEVVKEVIRLAEKKLDAQLAIISALAQRSGALASILGAGATAMFAAEVAMINLLRINISLTVVLIALVAPSIAYVGCIYCGLAAGTSKFQTAGNHPVAWKDNRKNEELREALIGEIENYQAYLTYNDKVISKLARYLSRGLRYGVASPIALASMSLLFLLKLKCSA